MYVQCEGHNSILALFTVIHGGFHFVKSCILYHVFTASLHHLNISPDLVLFPLKLPLHENRVKKEILSALFRSNESSGPKSFALFFSSRKKFRRQPWLFFEQGNFFVVRPLLWENMFFSTVTYSIFISPRSF